MSIPGPWRGGSIIQNIFYILRKAKIKVQRKFWELQSNYINWRQAVLLPVKLLPFINSPNIKICPCQVFFKGDLPKGIVHRTQNFTQTIG